MVSNEHANGQGGRANGLPWALIALGALLLVLALRGDWLALLGLPLLVLLRPAPVAAPEPRADGRGLAILLERLLPVWSRQVEAADRALQSGTEELLASFTHIVEHHERLAAEPQLIESVWQQAEKGLQGLQFADRLAQMLAVLRHDIDKLAAAAPQMEAASPADAERWLEELQQTYTTEEQRTRHEGHGPQAVRTKSVDFFD